MNIYEDEEEARDKSVLTFLKQNKQLLWMAVAFVFAVAPHHPLASVMAPLDDELVAKYRVVAVADSTQRSDTMSVGILAGQDVFTVATMSAKLDAQLRGLGIGLLPEPLARRYIESGRLIACTTQRPSRDERLQYAWRHLRLIGCGLTFNC